MANVTFPIRVSILHPAVATVYVSIPEEHARTLVKDGLGPTDQYWALYEAAEVLTATKGNAEAHVEISGDEALTNAIEVDDDAIVKGLKDELSAIKRLLA